MTSNTAVLCSLSRLGRCSAIAAGALLFCATAAAQSTVNIEKLKFELQQQKFALQEAIADREATAFRAEEVNSMLSESEEIMLQIEEEVKALCEERASLEGGSFDECMKSSGN